MKWVQIVRSSLPETDTIYWTIGVISNKLDISYLAFHIKLFFFNYLWQTIKIKALKKRLGYVKFSKLNTTYNIILLRIFFYLMYTVFNKKNKNVHTKIKRTRHELYCFCSIHDRLIHSTWTSVQTLDIWKCLFYLNGFIFYIIIWFDFVIKEIESDMYINLNTIIKPL